MDSQIVTFIYCCGADTEAVTASFVILLTTLYLSQASCVYGRTCNALKHLVEEEIYRVLIVAFLSPRKLWCLKSLNWSILKNPKRESGATCCRLWMRSYVLIQMVIYFKDCNEFVLATCVVLPTFMAATVRKHILPYLASIRLRVLLWHKAPARLSLPIIQFEKQTRNSSAQLYLLAAKDRNDAIDTDSAKSAGVWTWQWIFIKGQNPSKTEHKTESVEKSKVNQSQQKVKAKKIKKSKGMKAEGLKLPILQSIIQRG
uniref:Uncharacterized protein n=1 Tax=Tanacetum cinerariifolium TaxID=118510 RepID=A0A6L2KVD3_TANCI|nr:hypothetical protein [Tanacetum cinerariifolium]